MFSLVRTRHCGIRHTSFPCNKTSVIYDIYLVCVKGEGVEREGWNLFMRAKKRPPNVVTFPEIYLGAN